jgi:hypothetical protein
MMVVQRAVKAGRASNSKTIKAAKMQKSQSAVTWILLRDALALVAEAYQMQKPDFELVERWLPVNMLRNALEEGRVRSRGVWFKGNWKKDARQPPSFEDLRTVWEKGARINWQMSSADLVSAHVGSDRAFFRYYDIDGTYHRIEVAREDVSKLLPEGYEPRIPPALPATSSTAEPHPGGAPREYSREQILIEAAAYIVVNNLPETQTTLRDEIALVLGNRSPSDTVLGEILRPFYKRIAEVLAANR